jgi:hypothetical protein
MSDQAAGFTVDAAAVRTFGAGFQHDLDAHLSSERTQSLHVLATTPTFGGRTPSPPIQQAARDYHRRLLELYEVLDALLHNGAVLAHAAETIAESYETADTLSSADVDAALGHARQAMTNDTAADPKTGRPI